jgi:hypothetical protein
MKATKYEKVPELPSNAIPVAKYAKDNDISSPAYVQIKYNRHLDAGAKYPGYKIINWQGINFVIPD